MSIKEFARKHLKFSLATNIIIGMILGIAVGIFFGDACESLNIAGNGFIQLLQMTVLPYIVVSLILGIGGLTYENAKLLAVKGGVLMIIYWVIAFLVILTLPLIFPKMEQASFFSTSMVANPPEIDYLKMYIPSNPFRSLSENMVPAVTLLSLCLGIALIGMPGEKKKSLMEILDTIKEALTKVTHFVIKLTPIGVFAISASAAGTMTIDQFSRLQVYLVAYLIGTIAITFIILPTLVSLMTPFPFRKVLKVSRDALVTSFTTGNLFVILPIIVDNAHSMFESENLRNEKTDAYIDVLIPVTFNFPNIGKLLALIFVLFAGWFTGSQLEASQYPEFIASGLLTLFGSTDVALPFLLNTFRIPADLFQLYMVSGIVIGKLATMIAAMNLITFSIICTYSLTSKLKINLTRIFMGITLAVGSYFGILLVGKIMLSHLVKKDLNEAKMLVAMTIKDKVPTTIDKSMPKPGILSKLTGPKEKYNHLKQLRKSGVLRVGYNQRALPFAFLNKHMDLVGFDIQMAHALAKDLNCKLEFKPFNYKDFPDALRYDLIDIAMSCISINAKRLQKISFTMPYMEVNLAFVVKGHLKNEFEDVEQIKKNLPNLKFVILRGSAYLDVIKKALPGINIVAINSQEEFFTEKCKADAFVSTAEQGSAWTLVYPHYKVAIPKPRIFKNMIAYAVAKGDPDFLNYLNSWLLMEKVNNNLEKQYSYWILGIDPESRKKRWCIARDVLHWLN